MCSPWSTVSFAMQMLLGFMSFHLSIFRSFVSCALQGGCHIWKSVACFNLLKHFSYVLFQVSSGITCRSPIHFELSFVWDETLVSIFHLLHRDIPFPQHHQLGGSLFTVCFWHLCGEAAGRRHMGLWLGLLICSIAVFFFFFLPVPCCFGCYSSLTNSCATDLRSQNPVGELEIELQQNIRLESEFCKAVSWFPLLRSVFHQPQTDPSMYICFRKL